MTMINTTATSRILHILHLLLILLLLFEPITAWSTSNSNEKHTAHTNNSRREYIKQILAIPTSTSILLINNNNIQPAIAYTPDTNPLRESLYYISRVQEATVQQERFITKATKQDVLKNKMKLTLRLVEKNYKLLDQITFCAGMVECCALVCYSIHVLCMYCICLSNTLSLLHCRYIKIAS